MIKGVGDEVTHDNKTMKNVISRILMKNSFWNKRRLFVLKVLFKYDY